MSATRNTDAVSGQGGQFSSKVPRSEPLTTKGHQVGQKVSPKDHAPEFHVQTLPPGTAPPDRTFQPNNDPDFPPQATGSDDTETTTSAAETLGGSTSSDLHQGLGKPSQGMTSTELEHNGKTHRDREGKGHENFTQEHSSVSKDQRALERDDEAKPPQEKGMPAEEQIPTSSEELAAEIEE